MQPSKPAHTNRWILLPIYCSGLFLLLYFLAAINYPGGSYHNRSAPGFSWQHNYWCNLLSHDALNGETNSAKPYAIAVMIVLALGLLSFWVVCSVLMYAKKWVRLTMAFCGVVSIAALSFLSGEFHDAVINLSGAFGLAAMAGAYVGLYQKRWRALLYFGFINLLLIALNNYIYYSGNGINHLPLIQKITFLFCLFWIGLVTWRLYKSPPVKPMA